MRDRRKIIEINVDSALALMQEIYNDIVEQKNTASLIMKKMLAFMKEADDMSMIGPVIKDQQKILHECTEKKISLVKLQNAMLKQNGGSGEKQKFGKLELTADDRNLLEKLIDEKDNDSAEENNGEEEKYQV
jgi:hypothetical protein